MTERKRFAVYVITKHGLKTAEVFKKEHPDCDLYVSKRFIDKAPPGSFLLATPMGPTLKKTWKEYDWLADLVEIIDKNENPDDSYEYTKLQMFQENAFCFTPKGSIIKLPKNATPIDFAYAVHTQIGHAAIGCEINGNDSALQCI